MLFNKNDDKGSERIIYKTKPNMILGCKKAIYGFILLVVVLFLSPLIIKYIGKMQVYLISYVRLSLTRYAAIAFFVVILFIIIYIIWQLIGWYAMEYTLTDSKIIIKSGVLSTKRNYMPYTTIQDVNTSQSVFARLLNVGSVNVFSAYDNNQIELSNISNPSHVEEIIFTNMMGYRNFPQQPQQQRFVDARQNQYNREDYLSKNDFYDDFEPITPIARERDLNQRYEYYPEELDLEERPYNHYEYEPYEPSVNRNLRDDIQYEGAPKSYYEDSYHERTEYYPRDDDYMSNDSHVEDKGNLSRNVSNEEESSEKAIRRHFDKFKR